VTALLHIAAVFACIDLALLGLILATHWWRRNDAEVDTTFAQIVRGEWA
jgi:hypothetical protein